MPALSSTGGSSAGRRVFRPLAQVVTIAIPVAWICLLTLFEPPDWVPFIPASVVDAVTPLLVVRLLNIVLFVPLGLVLGCWWPDKLRVVWAAVALSTAIEVTQLWLPDRVSDPMDVLMNTAGAFAGFGVAAVLRHIGGRLRVRMGGR